MAKIIITFEDSPDGVIVLGYGAVIPKEEKDQTDAQKLAMLVKKILEEHFTCRHQPIH